MFSFVLGNSLSHFYYSYLNLLKKKLRGRVTWGTFTGTMVWKRFWVLVAAPWMVEDDGPWGHE